MKPHRLPSKCNSSAFAYRHHKHIVTDDLRIIKKVFLENFYFYFTKYWEARPKNLEKLKCYKLECLDSCISSWCCKNIVDNSLFSELTNNVKIKNGETISHLANNLYINKDTDCLLSPNVKNALHNIHKDFLKEYHTSL